jgi:ribosome-binding protein aMBF1 (putative translation factor)
MKGADGMEQKKEKVMRQFLRERLKDPDYRKFHEEEKLRSLFADEISSARKRAKLSQKELAERAGISEKAISSIERGEYKKLTFKIVQEIANATKSRIMIEYKPWTDD